MKPIVAIVGRPNVGKSTLFNRIVGGRRAIALALPGVSRDRHYAHASWDGREFVCIDTGGFPSDLRDNLAKKIRQQIEFAIDEASVILFVLDGKGGLAPEEEEIARLLRRSGKKFLLAVNKIDQPSHESRLADFYRLGGDVFPVSAEHGYKIGDLLDELVKDFPKLSETKAADEIRLSIIGRPNVGKSSLLNRLLGGDRAIVDAEPGTTRDVIDSVVLFEGIRYRILDTAGIRRRGRQTPAVERVSIIKSLQAVERSEICLLLLDAGEGIRAQDTHVAGYAFEAKKGTVVLWNKWDLVPVRRGVEKEYQKKASEGLKFLADAPVLTVSAKSGWGVGKIWGAVGRLHASCGMRIPTADVNRVFGELVASHNRPVYKGRPVKFLYATQTGIFPPTFVVFVDEPKGVHFSFQRYLKNGLRCAFGFDGAPIEIHFRKKR